MHRLNIVARLLYEKVEAIDLPAGLNKNLERMETDPLISFIWLDGNKKWYIDTNTDTYTQFEKEKNIFYPPPPYLLSYF